MELGEITKKARRGMNLSQKQFAKRIGSNQTEISFIERGFIPNNQDKIAQIYLMYNKVQEGQKQ